MAGEIILFLAVFIVTLMIMFLIVLFIWWRKLRKIKKNIPVVDVDDPAQLKSINFDKEYFERRYADDEKIKNIQAEEVADVGRIGGGIGGLGTGGTDYIPEETRPREGEPEERVANTTIPTESGKPDDVPIRTIEDSKGRIPKHKRKFKFSS
jgi:hypothetical protein